MTLQTRCAPYPLDSTVQRGQTLPNGNLPGNGPRRNPGRVKPSQLVELVQGTPLDLKWNVLVLVWAKRETSYEMKLEILKGFKLWLSGAIVANINVPMHSKVNLLYSLLGIPSKIKEISSGFRGYPQSSNIQVTICRSNYDTVIDHSKFGKRRLFNFPFRVTSGDVVI